MKRLIKKRTAFLLALMMTLSSLQPAFNLPVYAEPQAASENALPVEAVSEVQAAALPVENGENEEAADTASGNGAGNTEGTQEEDEIPASSNDAAPAGEPEERSSIWEPGEFEFGEGANDDEGFEVIDHPEELEGEEAAGITIPKSYNSELPLASRNMKNIAPVRNQGSTGLCWMFGAISAIESNVRKKYSLSWNDALNLSPKFSSWWILHKAQGSLGKFIDDDWIDLRNTPETDREKEYNALDSVIGKQNAYTRRGGNNWLSMAAFSSWLGPVNEDDSNSLKFHEQDTFTMLNNEPNLTDANPYRMDYQVQNVDLYAYPLKAKSRKDLEKMGEARVAEELNPLKQAILEKGALAGSMNTNFFNKDCSMVYDPGDPYPLEKNEKRYASTTHIVTIVGWDDDYDFNELFDIPGNPLRGKDAKLRYFSEAELKPPGKGAWICKNSWGERSGLNGFFYMSYYDGSLRTGYNSFAAYDVVDKKRNTSETVYDNNYQYNGLTTKVPINYDDSYGKSRYAYGSSPVFVNDRKHFGAMYTANTNETLKAVGIATREENLAFAVSVYTASVNGCMIGKVNELGGYGWKVSANAAASVPRAGFHTIKLDNGVKLKKGQQFLVVFEMTNGKGGDIIRQEATDPSGKYFYKRTINVSGRKYYLATEYYYKKASGFSFDDLDSDDGLSYKDNLDYDIKAFTTNGWDGEPGHATGKSRLEFMAGYEMFSLDEGDSIDMNDGLIFEPVSSDGVWDEIKEWTISGDQTVLRNDRNGKFTALKASENCVSVNVVTISGASATAEIYVLEKKVDPGINISLDRKAYDYTGSLISVSQDVTVTSGNTVIYSRGRYSVSGYHVEISENSVADDDETDVGPAIDAGDAVAHIVVTVSDDSVSDNVASQNKVLKTADILFRINPINISDTNKVRDSRNIDKSEIKEDGNIHKLAPELWLYDSSGEIVYGMVSRNSTDKDDPAYYDYDYDLEYMSTDYSTPGFKNIRVTGFGNFSGERIITYSIYPKDQEADPTLSPNGLYVSKVYPQTVEYNGNKHVVDNGQKRKKGYSCDLTLDVLYDGEILSEGKDYRLSYVNNVACNVGVEGAKESYVLVKGIGKYKGLLAKRYFAIAPAALNENNTYLTGVKALYPLNLNKTSKAVLNPAVFFSFTDDTGKVVNRKLKKASTKKGRTTGDYELQYYRFIYSGIDDFPSGQEEDISIGEWIKCTEAEYKKGSDENLFLVTAKGINNYTGESFKIEAGKDYPYPWPGSEAQFVVADKYECPGSGSLKSVSVKQVKIPADFKKLTEKNKSFVVDDLWQKTELVLGYKDANNKNAARSVKAQGNDFWHYLSCYDSNNREVFVIDRPGTYTLRIYLEGNFKAGELKGVNEAVGMAASKDVKLKVTSGMKLKASDYTLEYRTVSGNKEDWVEWTKNLKLEYDGTHTEFRVRKGETVITDDSDDFEVIAPDDNSFPGNYAVTLKGIGMYGNSSLTWKFKRVKLPLNKALESEGGSLNITVKDGTKASAFGAYPVIGLENGYEKTGEDIIDTAFKTSYPGLQFKLKNNKVPGDGKLVIKAGSDSSFSGSVEIPFKIDPYDISVQGNAYNMTDISSDAIKNKGRVFFEADDAFSAGAKPVVRAYQYDPTGTLRKEIPLNNNELSITAKDDKNYVVNLRSDKVGMIKFPDKGVDISLRVLDKSQKARKLEITDGDFITKEASKKGIAFTGRGICPTVTMVRATMPDGTTRELELSKKQFSVDYVNNVKAGTAKVIITAIGSSNDAVSGKQSFNFKIVDQK